MLKKLTYFNLLYGTCLFVLAITNSGRDIITMIAFLIVLLFNWLTLKQLEGFMVTTQKNQKVLRILTLAVAFIFLLNSVLALSTSYSGKFDIGINNVQYMPVNIVWDNLQGLNVVDFRKAVGNEARQLGSKANFEREYGHKIQQLIGGQRSGI